MKKRRGIVHVLNGNGHRREYRDLLANQLDLAPETGPVKFGRGLKLISSRMLIFATIGKGSTYFTVIAMARALLGRKTCALCMADNWYEDSRGAILTYLNYALFKLLELTKKCSVLSIMPTLDRVSPRAGITDWIYDVQLWDLHDDPAVRHLKFPETRLSERISEKADERPVLLYIGRGNRRKGYDELSQISGAIADKVLIVAAGKVDDDCKGFANELKSHGMIVIDRFIDDLELLSLYGVANYVWCRYSAENDLSSGVFGRAFQLGIPCIARKASFLDRLAEHLGHPVLYDAEEIVELCVTPDVDRSESATCETMAKRAEMITRIADYSLSKLKKYL